MATATLSNYRQSPRKVRVVADLIRGKSLVAANAQLAFLPKRAAGPLSKLLASALANAKNLDSAVTAETLYVSDIRVDKAPTLKRIMPRARGSASRINKRSSHVVVTLVLHQLKKPKNNMSHSVHPFSHRLGILRDWKSRWFTSDKKYREFLRCDVLLREYLVKRLRGMYVADIIIERSEKTMRVVISTSRPGMIIGRSGEGATKLRNDIAEFLKNLKAQFNQELKVDIEEVRSPESNSAIVGYMIAEGLEKRLPFRRVMKQMIDKVMANRDVKGVRIDLGGRLGGADMARQESLKKGRIPLQTLRADIDFAREKAHMTYGDIGIKVWIYKGEIFAANKPVTTHSTVAKTPQK